MAIVNAVVAAALQKGVRQEHMPQRPTNRGEGLPVRSNVKTRVGRLVPGLVTMRKEDGVKD
jgi:hypothetical protein